MGLRKFRWQNIDTKYKNFIITDLGIQLGKMAGTA
jgi:hypothetical protein